MFVWRIKDKIPPENKPSTGYASNYIKGRIPTILCTKEARQEVTRILESQVYII